MLVSFTVFCWNDMSLPHNGATCLKQICLSPVTAIYFMKRKSPFKTLTTNPISHLTFTLASNKSFVVCLLSSRCIATAIVVICGRVLSKVFHLLVCLFVLMKNASRQNDNASI